MQRSGMLLACLGFAGWFSSLFGRREAVGSPDDSPHEGGIEMFREDGTRVLVPRGEYERMTLAGIERSWDDADALYDAIVQGLSDGLARCVKSAAERLVEIDGASERATIVLAVTRSKSGDLAGARTLLEAYTARHRSGVALTNLAKVLDAQGDRRGAITMVRRGLAIDPNQDNGLALYGLYRREEGGEEVFPAAMEEIAREPGSWRALLWLARDRLERGDPEVALGFARRALETGSLDPEGMAMLTGDLGAHGQIDAMLEQVLPRYDSGRHGPVAGMNLLAACVERRRREEGLALCASLEAAGRPDLTARLAEWRRMLERPPT